MNWKRFTCIVAALMLIGIGGIAISAEYTDYTGANKTLSVAGIDPTLNWQPFVQYRKFDLNDSSFSGSGVTNGDVVRLFNVTPNTFITEVGFMNLRALHTGTSSEMGDGSDIDGYIGNDYSRYGVASGNLISKNVPFLDFATTGTGVSSWAYIGPISAGAGYVFVNGVSQYYSGSSGTTAWTVAHNYGAYLTRSGISCYASADTIDMTFYVDKSVGSRVTPYFEAYIKGFKRAPLGK